ncbi:MULTISPECIES: ImmA/IrrE family metallo-endopeptidase [Carnobacterium]|uniref:ImmA/IrrE family metallo-endopeptidase n=1 Tax=Carnobacterium inhibens TaxID=147709 RepID=A0ABR7TAW1_9LACT|nr:MULTISPECIES: ImmA/IrrE family metallo-endopeptidase [Carnobacterium]MBC9824635.1 ImmA/IrrE family metallo-endopeptidase [Carnobacterium inhibens]MCM3512031.1 ImmA/IrrE family metallo-endopeptidase [Carnobacterium inhibens]MDN5372691.1 hypothetical protein [Carnobacterium sp.]
MFEKWYDLIQQLYKEFKTYDPFVLAENKGIDVLYVPFGETPKGETVRFKDETIILLNEQLIEKNERFFVLAHELYHAIEHEHLSAYYTTQRNGKGTLEREANIFSGQLMIKMYEETYGFPPETFKDLQHHYGVSEELEDYLTR